MIGWAASDDDCSRDITGCRLFLECLSDWRGHDVYRILYASVIRAGIANAYSEYFSSSMVYRKKRESLKCDGDWGVCKFCFTTALKYVDD